MFRIRTVTRTAAHAVVALTFVGVAGCGAEIDGAKFSKDGDSFKIETDQGSIESSASLPKDFPSDEVPLLEGTVLNASSLDTEDARGYTVTMTHEAGSLSELADQASALLEDAGYTDAGTMDSGDLIIRSYENAAWTVSLTVTVSDNDPVVSYTVAGKAPEATP